MLVILVGLSRGRSHRGWSSMNCIHLTHHSAMNSLGASDGSCQTSDVYCERGFLTSSDQGFHSWPPSSDLITEMLYGAAILVFSPRLCRVEESLQAWS